MNVNLNTQSIEFAESRQVQSQENTAPQMLLILQLKVVHNH